MKSELEKMIARTSRHTSRLTTRLRGMRLSRRGSAMIGIALLLVLLGYATLVRAPSAFPEDDIITIDEGAALTQIAAHLAERDVVRSPLMLRAFVELLGGERTVHAGDYQFKRAQHVFAVAHAITTGDFGLEPVRVFVPEGASTADVAQIVSDELSRVEQADFLRAAEGLEGYLFPDTYFFLPTADEERVITAMLDAFEQNFQSMQSVFVAFDRPLDEVVAMASLLEKEASDFEDKRKIAGVLWRRLEIDMPLQVDAAFLYFLGRTTFDLTLEDLQHDSPYNTYRYKGLPPGPIANPGIESLRAAVMPIDNGHLYYLADNSGTTYFSETYEEHLQKKSRYLDS